MPYKLATNSKNKNIRDLYRGINEFKRGYQPEGAGKPGGTEIEWDTSASALR
jgi:hypothetical protein